MIENIIEIWRQLCRCRNSKETNHLTQQFFLLEIQPSDENIRGLKMVHRVCWFEMVGLGEVVSPCNSDPNRFIRVLLYFDGHLIMSGWWHKKHAEWCVHWVYTSTLSWTYRFDQLPEMSFKLLFELSQLYIMHVIFKTEKHKDVHERETAWVHQILQNYQIHQLFCNLRIQNLINLQAPGAGRHSISPGLDCQWHL